MGEAKRRGTFDDRKKQAVDEGREKVQPLKKVKRKSPFNAYDVPPKRGPRK